MSTMETQYSVVYAFKNGQYERAGNFYSSGTELFTYNVKLAYKDKNDTIYYTPAMNEKFSVTTSAHQNAVRYVLGDLEVK